MGTSFLDLTNYVIRRINETELTSANFASTRGMQSLVKDAVKDSILEISQQKWDWPFYSVETTQLLTKGTNEYSFPANFKIADWTSFQLVKDDALGVASTSLKLIDQDEWFRYYRDSDYDAGTDGVAMPRFVFKGSANKFGVTKSPDKAYTVRFKYFKNPTVLSAYGDTTEIPSDFDNVILAGAMYRMNPFRENNVATQQAKDDFKDGIRNMYNILVNNSTHMYDTRSNFGGYTPSSTWSN